MKVLKIIIPIVLAVVLAVSGIKLIKKRQAADEKEKTATIFPIVVKTFIPKEKIVTLTFPYIAEVKSDKEVVVNSKFAGKLLYVKNLGDNVKKGEVVAKIDNSDLEAKLEDINANIQSLQDKLQAEKLNINNLYLTHKRTKKLLDVKMASIEEYQNEETKIASLKAQIKADKNNLKALEINKKSILNNLTYTTIKSPINGIVSAKFLNQDDNVFMGKPILKIASKNGNYLFITLPKIKKAIIYKNKEYKLIPLNMSVNGLLAFKAKVDDPTLVNGQKVNVNIIEYQGDAIAIPYEAILSIDGKNYVFNTKGESKEIKIIAKGKDKVVVHDITQKILIAKPDILLKIKAGYPVKVEK